MRNFLLAILLLCQPALATDFWKKVRIRDTTTSTSTSTGSLRVDGGLGVAGTSYFGGESRIYMSAGPMFTLQDGGTAGTNASPYMRFMDGAPSEMGYVGFVTEGSLAMSLFNLKNGDLVLGTNNTNYLTIDNGGLHTLVGSLGIGDGVPTSANIFNARKDQNSATRATLLNYNTGSSAYARFTVGSDAGDINLDANSLASGGYGQLNIDSSFTDGFEISMGGTRNFRIRSNASVRSTWDGSTGEQKNEKPFVLAHSATPASNPSAGYVKIYPKSDNRFYTLTSGGTESELLTTSSGIEARMNHLYNGNFDVWQRGTSTTIANGATKYQADRWYVQNGLGTNGVITYSRVAGTSTGAKYGAQVQITTEPTAAQTNATYLYQVLENFDTLPLIGKTASFQIKVKALNKVNQVALRFMYKTTEAKPDSNIGSATICNISTGSFTTCEISSEALGTSMTNAGSLAVQVQINAVSSDNMYDLNNGFIVEQAMVVIGAPPTEFKTKYQSFTEELTACYRYYEKSYAIDTNPGTSTVSGAVVSSGPPGSYNLIGASRYPVSEVTTRFPIRKRTAPTVTPYSTDGTIDTIRDGTDSTNHAAIAELVTDGSFIITTGGGITDGEETAFHWTADAEI